jgi:hypothetical protein
VHPHHCSDSSCLATKERSIAAALALLNRRQAEAHSSSSILQALALKLGVVAERDLRSAAVTPTQSQVTKP